MSRTTQKQTQDFANVQTVQTPSLLQRAAEYIERMYARCTRKPQSLYDLRDGKSMPYLARHVMDHRRRLSEGASPDAVLDGHEFVAAEIESSIADEPSRIEGRLYLALDEAIRREMETECEANPIATMVAVGQRDLASLKRLRDVTIREVRGCKQLLRAVDREIRAKEILERQCGPFGSPIGVA